MLWLSGKLRHLRACGISSDYFLFVSETSPIIVVSRRPLPSNLFWTLWWHQTAWFQGQHAHSPFVFSSWIDDKQSSYFSFVRLRNLSSTLTRYLQCFLDFSTSPINVPSQPSFCLTFGSYCSLSKRNVASKSIRFLVCCIPVRPQAIKLQINHNYTFCALLDRFLSPCKIERLNEPIRTVLILFCM